jgi:uncharacterized metal-binding protein YceD (DUF177 family)
MSEKDDRFKIYAEQLRDGHVEKINETYTPDFIDLDEERDELHFNGNVEVNGEAYLADENLILHLKIDANATIPCSICNGPVEVEIELPNFYHMEPLADIKGGIFNFHEILREAILLEVPAFGECHGGNCPERPQVAKYIKATSSIKSSGDDEIDEGYQPFADIDFDNIKPKS